MSARARRVRLVMSDRGLEVVLPRGHGGRGIRELVDSQRAWIERHAERFAASRRHLELDPPRLPHRIVLPALGEEWQVEYRCRGEVGCRADGKERAGVRVRTGKYRRLVVTGDTASQEEFKAALCRWLNRRAREKLGPWLDRLAKAHGLRYERLSIRQQRTRWGSCSRRGSISLNAKLVFMPPEAVDYVLLHELCHTVEMNHSPQFWALLATLDPDYREHRKLVRAAAKTIPGWLDRAPREGVI